MGTRGHVGGLAEATLQAVVILDAAGKDVIFLETVGTGQSDVGVASIADTVVLVLQPGSGDSVQALKAGIMEIPDVIAVNKADHPLAQTMVKDVRQVLALDPAGPQPPIVLTDALRGDGIGELWTRIDEHLAALGASGELETRRRDNLAAEVFTVAAARARRRLERAVAGDAQLRELLERVGRRELDPLTAAHEILQRALGPADGDEDDTHTR
jgi:LAO/AO transport system kinase